VRNFTDVDDKIIARAAPSGEEPLALAARFIDEFHTDMVGAAGFNGCRPASCAMYVLGRRGRQGCWGRGCGRQAVRGETAASCSHEACGSTMLASRVNSGWRTQELGL
jgi:hypothetical protein